MGIIVGHYKNSFKTTRKVGNRGFFRGSIRHLKVKDDSGITPAVFFQRQEHSIQEIINQQLLLQEQLRPLADGGEEMSSQK